MGGGTGAACGRAQPSKAAGAAGVKAEEARKEEQPKNRGAIFERILENTPLTFTPAQLRVLLRALVNLDPYTCTDDLVAEIVGEDENDRRTAEEVLLSTINGLADDELTRFALRLVLTGHVGIPGKDEIDFLTEAKTVFAPPAPKKSAKDRKEKQTPIKATKSRPTRKPQLASRSQPNAQREPAHRLPLFLKIA